MFYAFGPAIRLSILTQFGSNLLGVVEHATVVVLLLYLRRSCHQVSAAQYDQLLANSMWTQNLVAISVTRSGDIPTALYARQGTERQ